MDIGTLIGLVVGSLLLVASIMQGGSLGAFIDIGSMMVTMGGSAAALLITYPVAKVKAVVTITKKTLNAGSLDMTPWYQEIVDLATIARRDGILALEDKITNIEDKFLKGGLQMLVDGSPADSVKNILNLEIDNMEDRHAIGHDMWASLGSYAPAFGMIGTLIGLVNMLQNLSDPSQVGIGMAVALLTTFYGAVIANLFCIPIQGKLEQRTKEEVQLKRMLLVGVLGIQAGDSPRVVGEKLQVYMPPSARPSDD